MDHTPAPIFRRQKNPIPSSALPSSSPSFGTPAHPLKPFSITAPKAAILPIILPPATLRPLAFRIFTKKHSLTLTSAALGELAAFVGRHCGSGWREEGLAERVLEEVARSWKNRNGGVIVDGSRGELQEILKTLEGNMSGGKIVAATRGLPRGDSMLEVGDGDALNTRLGLRPSIPQREDSTASFGMSGLGVNGDADDEDDDATEARSWLKVIGAFEQPRMLYNVGKKHFERETEQPSLLPPASHKTALFRNRFNVVHQRLLRNEAFHTSAVASSRKRSFAGQQTLKITPIANLLGRHGSNHMLLGQLVVLPTGDLAVSDMTGTIALQTSHIAAVPEDAAWYCPGMIVLLDGVYEEEDESVGKGLSGNRGVGGTLGGHFQGFFIGQPPCERRRATQGISHLDGGQEQTIGGGFGWIDFLGVGSERAVGAKMRRLEHKLLNLADEDGPARRRMVVLAELNLDQPRVLQAIRKILSTYASDESEGSAIPLTFVLAGNFTQQAVMARGGSGGSIEYKEYFDALAAILADFPRLLRSSTFVFVPGDHDGWVSSFTAGASVPLPRKAVPSMFTSRIRRVFATANAESNKKCPGTAEWTTNPSRLSLFGTNHEIVLFRDDLSARLRRASITIQRKVKGRSDTESKPPEETSKESNGLENEDRQPEELMEVDKPPPLREPEKPAVQQQQELPEDVRTAQKLVKTLLDQGYLAPFSQTVRPVHWDFASTLHLYPLPSAMMLIDTTAPPFCVTYEGCHVMNPGSVLVPGRKGLARWVEYQVGEVGKLRECTF